MVPNSGIISDYLFAVDTRVNPELLDWVMNEMVKVIPTIADPTIARMLRGNLSQETFEAQSKPDWLGKLNSCLPDCFHALRFSSSDCRELHGNSTFKVAKQVLSRSQELSLQTFGQVFTGPLALASPLSANDFVALT